MGVVVCGLCSDACGRLGPPPFGRGWQRNASVDILCSPSARAAFFLCVWTTVFATHSKPDKNKTVVLLICLGGSRLYNDSHLRLRDWQVAWRIVCVFRFICCDNCLLAVLFGNSIIVRNIPLALIRLLKFGRVGVEVLQPLMYVLFVVCC